MHALGAARIAAGRPIKVLKDKKHTEMTPANQQFTEIACDLMMNILELQYETLHDDLLPTDQKVQVGVFTWEPSDIFCLLTFGEYRIRWNFGGNLIEAPVLTELEWLKAINRAWTSVYHHG